MSIDLKIMKPKSFYENNIANVSPYSSDNNKNKNQTIKKSNINYG